MNTENCNALQALANKHSIWNANYAPLGSNNGRHIVRNQWTETTTDNAEFDDLQPYSQIMFNYFKQAYPQVAINNFMMEHRSYVMDTEPFVGNIHDDSCEHTIICYYEIGSGIRGGNLNLYDIEENLLSTYTPKPGDIKVFSGKHGVTALSATAKSVFTHQNQRSILTIFINMHD